MNPDVPIKMGPHKTNIPLYWIIERPTLNLIGGQSKDSGIKESISSVVIIGKTGH